MQVYLRAHPSLQGDMEQWASALSALGERSQAALRFLLGFLTGDTRITQTVSASLFGGEEDSLCLADDFDYLVVNYLTGTEIVRSFLSPFILHMLYDAVEEGCSSLPLLAAYQRKVRLCLGCTRIRYCHSLLQAFWMPACHGASHQGLL